MSQEILGLAASDLACYAVATHPNFELAHHTRAIIDKLEAVERGGIKRLMILCPPRTEPRSAAHGYLPEM